MERPKPKEILVAGRGFTVYCQTEDRILYISEGKNLMVERIVAENTAYGHADDLGHKVYIIDNSKLKFNSH